MREHLKDLTKQYDKSENDLKALQSVGQVYLHLCRQNIMISYKFILFYDYLNFIDCWRGAKTTY